MSLRVRNVVVNGILVVGALSVCLVLIEALFVFLKPTSRSSLEFSAGKGFLHVPGAHYVHRKEGYSEGRYNSHGFRDRDRTTQKPAGTYRIVVLGDSYTEGLQVPLEDTFVALLEEKLNASGLGRYFEVLNLGQSGFGTADALVRYVGVGREYSPDLVILAFCTGNDVRNNSKDLNRGALGYYFTIDGTDQLRLDESVVAAYEARATRLRDAVRWFKRHSYLASLVSERLWLLRSARSNSDARGDLRRLAEGRETISERSDLNVYLDKPPAAWQEAWRVTFALLKQLDSEVNKDGARLLVVTLSNPEQFDLDAQRSLPVAVRTHMDFDLPDRLIREYGNQHDIAVVNLAPALRKRVDDERAVLHGFTTFNTGHWNQRGHLAAAEEIGRLLLTSGLLTSDRQHPSTVDSSTGQDPTTGSRGLQRSSVGNR